MLCLVPTTPLHSLSVLTLAQSNPTAKGKKMPFWVLTVPSLCLWQLLFRFLICFLEPSSSKCHKLSEPSKYGTQTSAISVVTWELVEVQNQASFQVYHIKICIRMLTEVGEAFVLTGFLQFFHCLFRLSPAKLLSLPAIYFKHIIQ